MPEPDKIDADSIMAQIYQAGFSIFEGLPDTLVFPEVKWEGEDDDSLTKFLVVAKDVNKKMLFVEPTILTKEDVDDLEADKLSEVGGKVVAELEKRIGQCGAIDIAWLDDGMLYSYFQVTSWYGKYLNLFSEQEARANMVQN